MRLSPRLISNNYTLLKEAAASGVGVALLPAFDCLEEITDGRLVALLPEWCSSDIPLNALYAGSREASAKLRIFLDALFERMKPLTWIQPRSG